MNKERKSRHSIEASQLRKYHKGVIWEMQNQPVLIIPENQQKIREVEDLPSFTDERVRVGNRGKVYLQSFPSIRGQKQKELQREFETDKKIVYERWSECPDIMEGIRMADHIAEGFDRKDGNEWISVQSFVRLLNILPKELKQDVDRERLKELREYTAKTIVRSGWDNALLDEKQYIIQEIDDALQEDSMNRVNTPRSRMKLVQVRPRLTRILYAGIKTDNKYTLIGGKLLTEYESEKFPFIQLVRYARDCASMKPNNTEYENAMYSLRNFVHKNLAPDMMKVQPFYSLAARMRYFTLSNMSEDDYEKLVGYVGEDEAKGFENSIPFRVLRPIERSSRLRSMASEVEYELAKADKILTDGRDSLLFEDVIIPS